MKHQQPLQTMHPAKPVDLVSWWADDLRPESKAVWFARARQEQDRMAATRQKRPYGEQHGKQEV